ncbi:MAG TPA: HEAT repeat domain-containing protein [Pyrinomonadaceae bacterium]|nr:HEAT repeat domain-containing protein [Pyrinomonadaceae bacterium]
MDDNRWNQLVIDIEGDDIELMVEACEHLQNEAEISDVSRLVKLLEYESFVVREAAAWPLAILGDATVIPELFTAYQRGFEDGHDNDGFSAALAGMAELHPQPVRQMLLELKNSTNPDFKKYPNWLLEFC